MPRRGFSAVPGSFTSLTFSYSSCSPPKCLIPSRLSIIRCTTMKCGSAIFSTNRMSRSRQRHSSLEFQPTFLDILPLYILLLLIFPVVLLGLRSRPLIVLVPSFLLYLLVQATDLSVPAYPEGHVWYFNPLAWQFLFITGAALGLPWRHEQRWSRPARPILPLAVTVVAAGPNHQAQLDDPRYLGPVSRPPSQGVVASEQKQLVPDPGHSLLRSSRGRRHRR